MVKVVTVFHTQWYGPQYLFSSVESSTNNLFPHLYRLCDVYFLDMHFFLQTATKLNYNKLFTRPLSCLKHVQRNIRSLKKKKGHLKSGKIVVT